VIGSYHRRVKRRAGAALGLAGIPAQISVPIAAVGIWLIIVRGSYRSAERIFIWFTIPFFAYPIAAILAKPHWHDVGQAIVSPQLHTSSTYLLLLIATIGTTITPYMQLYLQSAVVERGVREDELERDPVASLGAVERDPRDPLRDLIEHRARPAHGDPGAPRRAPLAGR